LLDVLGAGGMAVVFRAREESLRRIVAVKVLAPALAEDENARARFTREARAVAAISHANVIGVYGVGETPALGLPYIVMQYVDGPTLSAWMRMHPRGSEATARRIISEIAGALAAAHAHGVVHRDVKPGNVLVEAMTGRAIVLDFGVSALRGAGESEPDVSQLTSTGIVVGTPIYMSPEQAAGEKVNAPADVYSLGILAYELLAGDLPFKANSAMGWAAAHMRDIPRPLTERRPDISPEVAQLVHRCLEKNPDDRPPARDIAAGMSLSVEAEIQWPPPGLAALRGRGRTLGRVAGVAAVAAVVIAACLAFPPALARTDSEWWTRYAGARDVSGSSLGVVDETKSAASPATMWLWRIAMGIGLATLVVGSSAVVGVGARTAVRAARARQRTWKWTTIADVLADPDGRNGLLIVGARELAALDQEHRLDALRARRLEVAGLVTAGGWALFALGTWALAAVLGVARLDGSGALLHWPMVVTVAIPAILALGVVVSAMRREARALSPLPRRRPHAAASAREHSGDANEVVAWYSAIQAQPASGGMSLLTARAGATVISAAAIASVFATALVVAAAYVAAQNLEQLGPETARLASTIRRLRESDPLGEARRAWLSYLPPTRTMSESEARDALYRFIDAGSSADALPQFDPALARLLGVSGAGKPAAVAEAIKAAAHGMAPDSLTLFTAAAAHPRTMLVRGLAASGTDLFTATLPRPMGEYQTATDVPEPPYPQLRLGAQANALGAVVAVSNHDYVDAERRLGENAALAERFLAVPRRFAGTFGAGMLQELSLLPLAEVEDLRGDPRRGVELRRAADMVRDLLLDPVWDSRSIGLAATPDDLGTYTSFIRDPHIPAGLRAEALTGGLLGYCLNSREVVGGPSALRADAVRHSADSVAEVPALRGLAALAAQTWQNDRMRGDASSASKTILTRLLFCANIARH
jgi:hypothetical protein